MSEIKVHVFHTGEGCVAPELPFGGEHCSALKASGLFDKKSTKLMNIGARLVPRSVSRKFALSING